MSEDARKGPAKKDARAPRSEAPKRRKRGKKKRRDGSLGSLADALAKVYPGKTRFAEARVFGAWNECVPVRVARNAQPFRLSRGVLTVHVKNSVWAQELSFLREDILAALTKQAPEGRVRDIRFRVGRMPEVARIPHLEREPPRDPPAPAPLSAEIEASLAELVDPELQRVIREAAQMGLGRREEEAAREAAGREAAALRERADRLEAEAKKRRR